MSKYQYNGEHFSVTVEGVKLVRGENVLSASDEKVLLASGFAKAMLASGELVQLDKPKPESKQTKSEQAKSEQVESEQAKSV